MDESTKINLSILKINPSEFWKFMVDKFLKTLNETEQNNFKLASNKFAAREPHLYIKEVPWFKTWYKENSTKYLE
jgi:hypothetical protein